MQRLSKFISIYEVYFGRPVWSDMTKVKAETPISVELCAARWRVEKNSVWDLVLGKNALQFDNMEDRRSW